MAIDAELADKQNEVVIKISGRFDFNQVQAFRDAYKNNLNHRGKFIIDMREVDYMDSSGLGMLLNMRKSISGDINKIKIINCRPQLKKILLISRFDKKFIIE